MSNRKGGAGATAGPWTFRTVHDAEPPHQRIALLLERPTMYEGDDPCILAVREDWIRFLLDTPEGKARLAMIASAPALRAEVERLRADVAALKEACDRNAGTALDLFDQRKALREALEDVTIQVRRGYPSTQVDLSRARTALAMVHSGAFSDEARKALSGGAK